MTIPVNVITGFLGSGKTTLLRRLLQAPALGDTAVLINEFGEIGLDHHLVGRIDERTMLLQSGCICCSIRGELSQSIRDLFDRRERGETPRFRRLVIETTGLAEPAPIVSTILADPVIRHHFRLGSIIAVVDVLNGARNLGTYPESLRQAAAADRLVISKSDIADPAMTAGLKELLGRINPAAPLLDGGTVSPGELLTDDPAETAELRRWLGEATQGGSAHGGEHGHDHDRNRHGADISAFCIAFDSPLQWEPFSLWLTMLLHRHGERVLRVKGILDVAGGTTPVVVHGVQHVIHPPAHMEAWPDDDRRTRIVFITQGLSRERIEASLATFNRLAAAA